MSVWWRKQSRGGRRAGGGGRSRWNMAGALSLPMLAPRLAFYPAHILWEWVPHDHIKQRLFVVNKAGAASLRVLDLSLCIALSLSLSLCLSIFLSSMFVVWTLGLDTSSLRTVRLMNTDGQQHSLFHLPPSYDAVNWDLTGIIHELRLNWDYPWIEINLRL